MVEMLMRHGICLNRLFGIHLNLRRLVVLLDIHLMILVRSMLDLIMHLPGVICVILLTMLLICVLIMHTMLQPWTILMLSCPYMIHHFLLVQCTGLEVGQPFGAIARFSVVDACFESEDTLDKVYDLHKTPLEGSRDVFVCEDFASLGCNNVFPNPLGHSHVSPICSLPSHSPKYYLNAPIDNFMIYDANVDLGYENNIFSMLGGHLDNYVSLG